MNKKTVFLATIIVTSLLNIALPQSNAIPPQRKIINGETVVAWVTDAPPSTLKSAEGRITIIAFNETDRAKVNVCFKIPEDDLRVTINLVSVKSVEFTECETIIIGNWDVLVNGQIYLDNAWGFISVTDPTGWGLDIGAYGQDANVKIKGTISTYK